MADTSRGAGSGGASAEIRRLLEDLDEARVGEDMRALIRELFPICRSITGEGVRRSLRLVERVIPLCWSEVPSGTAVFDWVVPREWNIRDAWVKDPSGAVVIDFKRSNLHVLNYSVPFRGRVELEELKRHLHSIPEQGSLVPYRTSYYKESWGFCLSHEQLQGLPPGEYEVLIDSSLREGALTYAEHVVQGAVQDEVLVSCHCCHPSLCNDNLSGMALAATLARLVGGLGPRYTYRFLFVPGTIGAIAWLSRNEERAHRIKHGLVVACVGDAGPMTFKRSRRGNAEIDRAVEHVLGQSGQPFSVRDFTPYGYDERQYCSPGFDLPVGSLTRTPHGEYPEYHTSGDDLALVKTGALVESLRRYLEVFEVLEGNGAYVNLSPRCEPQLGKRGLYGAVGGRSHAAAAQMALLWVLNLSDGRHTLLDIADRAKLPFPAVRAAASSLERVGLLAPSDPAGDPIGRGPARERGQA
jgi:aminopeptidase-like protein